MTKEKALKLIESLSESKLYRMERDITIKGRHCVVAWFYGKEISTQTFEFGVTDKSYEADREDIETAIERGLQKARIRELKRSWKVKALTESILCKLERDLSTGAHFYKLEARVPMEVWNKVKKWFTYARLDFDGREYVGWVTSEPEKVKETLKELAEEQATKEEKEITQEIIRKE